MQIPPFNSQLIRLHAYLIPGVHYLDLPKKKEKGSANSSSVLHLNDIGETSLLCLEHHPSNMSLIVRIWGTLGSLNLLIKGTARR